MGVAVINEDTCLSFSGHALRGVLPRLPLIDEAITIDYRPAVTTSTRCSRAQVPMGARVAACASSAAGERPRARHCGGAHRRSKEPTWPAATALACEDTRRRGVRRPRPKGRNKMGTDSTHLR